MRIVIRIFCLILMTIPLSALAQKWKLTRYEAIIGIGTTNYFGDIGGSADKNSWFGIKDISLLRTRASLYAAARYKIEHDKAIKLSVTFGWLNGTDKGSKNASRNYSFNSFISEQTLQFEYSFLAEDRRRYSFALFNRRGMMNNYSKINVYGFLGVGGLFCIPSFKGILVNPESEIVQKTSFYTGVIPAGIGLKLIYNNRYALGFEFGGRYVFSDVIDGLTSSYSKAKDIYYFGVFNLVYRIKTDRKGRPIIFRRF
jgi:hypothetical protein